MASSCLPDSALSHFEQREQELLALNQELEQKCAKAAAQASGALQEAENAVDRHRPVQDAQDAELAAMRRNMHQYAAAEVPSFASTVPMSISTDEGNFREFAPVDPPTASAEAALASKIVNGSIPKQAYTDAATEELHVTIRSQHLRIVALQEELSKNLADLAARNSEVHDAKQEAKQATLEVERLRKVLANHEQTQEREKKKCTDLDRKHQDAMRELSELAKERDQLDVHKRKLDAEVASKDARINRLTEECERYKTAAKDLGNQDRDRAVADRRETDRLQGEVRKLERQRAELVNAFKKQMKLIDVLKRQRAHVEAARVLSFTEDEFIRIMELGDKLGE